MIMGNTPAGLGTAAWAGLSRPASLGLPVSLPRRGAAVTGCVVPFTAGGEGSSPVGRPGTARAAERRGRVREGQVVREGLDSARSASTRLPALADLDRGKFAHIPV